MEPFPSGFVENTWHQAYGFPTFPSPPDTHFDFHSLESSNTLVNCTNNVIQLDPWFCQRWLRSSGEVQTEALADSVHGQSSSETTHPGYDISVSAQPAQELHSCAVPKAQQYAKPQSRRTITTIKQSYPGKRDKNCDSGPDEASRIRERNRNIARKYRGRKQHEAEAMEAYVEKLQQENAILRARCNGLNLKEEVLDLKSLLLQHSECNCAMIQAFIATEAKRSLHSLLSPNPSG
ncbi:hypothetical protein F52700_4407 [Fusarium sp. NRRL 52700]|nr:hypothetical protein F52700_4407 [Fusarium sp. NRRL 52700]